MLKLSDHRIVRFLVCGAITALFNIGVIWLLISVLGMRQPFWQNVANLVAIEISLLFSFFVYRAWVWSESRGTAREVLQRQIPLYHVSCGISVFTRSFILFPLLNWLGVNYAINTLIGIVIGSGINYVASDRWVFK